jgi:hypothetical protein
MYNGLLCRTLLTAEDKYSLGRPKPASVQQHDAVLQAVNARQLQHFM